jgi:hypothetical protein
VIRAMLSVRGCEDAHVSARDDAGGLPRGAQVCCRSGSGEVHISKRRPSIKVIHSLRYIDTSGSIMR